MFLNRPLEHLLFLRLIIGAILFQIGPGHRLIARPVLLLGGMDRPCPEHQLSFSFFECPVIYTNYTRCYRFWLNIKPFYHT